MSPYPQIDPPDDRSPSELDAADAADERWDERHDFEDAEDDDAIDDE